LTGLCWRCWACSAGCGGACHEERRDAVAAHDVHPRRGPDWCCRDDGARSSWRLRTSQGRPRLFGPAQESTHLLCIDATAAAGSQAVREASQNAARCRGNVPTTVAHGLSGDQRAALKACVSRREWFSGKIALEPLPGGGLVAHWNQTTAALLAALGSCGSGGLIPTNWHWILTSRQGLRFAL
jgi:hypothetical protein